LRAHGNASGLTPYASATAAAIRSSGTDEPVLKARLGQPPIATAAQAIPPGQFADGPLKVIRNRFSGGAGKRPLGPA
jgi:hypothetical protein